MVYCPNLTNGFLKRSKQRLWLACATWRGGGGGPPAGPSDKPARKQTDIPLNTVYSETKNKWLPTSSIQN